MYNLILCRSKVLQAVVILSGATFLFKSRVAVSIRSRRVLQGAVISNDASTQAPRCPGHHTASRLHIMMTAVIVMRAKKMSVGGKLKGALQVFLF